MSSYVYLIRNGDLYKIGKTNNLQQQIKTLKPDEIIKTIEASDSRSLEARLFRRYKTQRIPGSAYFRLSKDQLADCKKQLSSRGAIPRSLSAEVSISLTASILLMVISSSIELYLGIGLFKSFSLAFLIGSIPMWSLFFLGNFGGYDVTDLPIFSSWINRIKALFFGVSITCIAYMFYLFIR